MLYLFFYVSGTFCLRVSIGTPAAPVPLSTRSAKTRISLNNKFYNLERYNGQNDAFRCFEI